MSEKNDQAPTSREERAMMKLIDERDGAQDALSQAYYIVMGHSPEWSNHFGYDEALEDIEDACTALRLAARQGKRA